MISENSSTRYVLGHSEEEIARLARQAALVNRFTKRFFLQAGIKPGMRVLDVGTGAGDTAFLLHEIVGRDGEVVGVDRSEKAVVTARRRASARDMANATFLVGDPSLMDFDRPFDAVAGRYVLMFQSAPDLFLRNLVARVRAGGIIAFHEANADFAHSSPAAATYDQCWRWIKGGFGTADPRLAAKFPTVFGGAGLPTPKMALEALIGAGTESDDCIELATDLVATLLPELLRQGLTTEGEVDVSTLKQRVAAEAYACGSVLVGRAEIGAWCRAP
jgi:SAM-dependent methyltransferase